MMIMIIVMRRENEFELKLGKPPADQAPKVKGLRGSRGAGARRAGGKASGPKPRQPGIRAHFAPGSKNRPRARSATSRRVVVKVRYAANTGGKVATLRAHVAYLAREAAGRAQGAEVSAPAPASGLAHDPTEAIDTLSRAGEVGTPSYAFFDGERSTVDARAMTRGWAGDPRHFRMIISAEDGEALGDLKPFIREVMAGLEMKLGTKLEWLAVNHHDTDNPHTHVLIRGRRADGEELFIPSRLIKSGIREQAEAIVTRVLGPRLAAAIEQDRFREIDRRGPTGLDGELLSAAANGPLYPARADLAARLERLETWELASRSPQGWRLAPHLVESLRSMEAHDDIVRTVVSSLAGRPPQPLLAADRSAAVTGELVHYGPADEFADRFLAIIETGAGVLRYARFDRTEDLAALTGIVPGAMVTFAPHEPALRPADRAIARIAALTGGVYSAEAHARIEPHVDPALLEANIRRLESMRRMGFAESLDRGVFHVGDHASAALAFEERLASKAPVSVRINSYWTLSEQIEAMGPTQLDAVLTGEAAGPTGEGKVARAFDQALQQRRLFLIEQGWMGGHEPQPSRHLLTHLRQVELAALTRSLRDELGMPVTTSETQRVSGVYARRIDLAQGRMALIVDEHHAHVVPWRPPLERFAGRKVEGVLRGQGLSWSLQRELGIGMAPQ